MQTIIQLPNGVSRPIGPNNTFEYYASITAAGAEEKNWVST